MHGRVPLTNILQGELKAVKKQAAEKFVKAYGIQMKKKSINHLEGSNSGYSTCQWLTAQDLCSDCAQDLRKEAVFSQSLDEIEPLLTEILKNPERAVAKNSYGPDYMLLVSRKELTAHKQLALQQREYKRSLQQQKATFITFATKFPEVKEEKPLSPPPRKRKVTEDVSEATTPLPSYQVKTDPTSPLKLKLCLAKPPLANGNTFKIEPVPQKQNGIMNGKSISTSPSTKKSLSVASDESGSVSEEDEELESEDDPEWNGRETPPPGNKRKGCRSFGTPRKRKKLQKQNGGAPEKEKELLPPAQPVIFNSDIICPHLKIKHGAKMVRISEDEWSKIVTPFFDEFYKFSADCYECDDCEEEKNQDAKVNRQNKEIVAQINSDISVLLKTLEKRKFSQNDLGTKYTNVICGKFLDDFRTVAKSRSSSVSVPSLCQGCLICVHKRPYAVLDPNCSTNAMPVTKDEWNSIVKSYQKYSSCKKESPIEITLSSDGACVNHCADCYMAYCERENKKRFEYVNASLFIKLKDDSGDSKKPARPLTTRRVAAKSLSRVTVNSSQTVSELKIDLYRRLGISPIDMLMINGENVLEDDKTLGESRVPVNNEEAPLILIVQSHDEDVREIDRGFQDTALAF
uniref:Ubiquitin-like domain-containing protein n=1 Tax=Panagrolaimus superbus TaxID=310955 RepID=A0A914YVV0_9BILA